MESNQPLSDVEVKVRAFSPSMLNRSPVRTDGAGAFAVEGVSVGESVQVMIFGERKTHLAERRTVEVAKGTPQVDIGTIRLTRGNIEERIKDGTWEGLTGLSNSEDEKAMVAQARPGGPAEKAGIKTGDAILAIDGKDVRGLGFGGIEWQLRGRAGSPIRSPCRHRTGPRTVTFNRFSTEEQQALIASSRRHEQEARQPQLPLQQLDRRRLANAHVPVRRFSSPARSSVLMRQSVSRPSDGVRVWESFITTDSGESVPIPLVRRRRFAADDQSAATGMATGRASRRWRRARRRPPKHEGQPDPGGVRPGSRRQAATAASRCRFRDEGLAGRGAIRSHGPLAVFSSAQQGEPSGAELPARSVVSERQAHRAPQFAGEVQTRARRPVGMKRSHRAGAARHGRRDPSRRSSRSPVRSPGAAAPRPRIRERVHRNTHCCCGRDRTHIRIGPSRLGVSRRARLRTPGPVPGWESPVLRTRVAARHRRRRLPDQKDGLRTGVAPQRRRLMGDGASSVVVDLEGHRARRPPGR